MKKQKSMPEEVEKYFWDHKIFPKKEVNDRPFQK